MRHLATGIFLLIAAPLAAQEQLFVRSAEHPDYSRLLVTVPSGADWVIARDGRRAEVSFPGLRQDFTLDNVFDRMPRTRIVSVQGRIGAIGSTLELALACACEVNVSRVGSRFVAIDVQRDTTTNQPVFSRRVLNPSVPDRESAQNVEARSSEVSALPATGPERRQSRPEVASEAATAGGAPRSQAGQLVLNPAETADARNEEAALRELETVRNSLLEQLQTAAEEGLIEVDNPEELAALRREADQAPPTEDAFTLADEPMPSEEALSEDSAVVEAVAETETGEMDDTGHMADAPLVTESQVLTRLPFVERPTAAELSEQPAPTCPDNRRLNVHQWGGDEPVSDRIGELRRALVADHGGIDQDAVQELARYYIAIGFGREAEQILSHAREEEEFSSLLADLARAVEGREVLADGALGVLSDCDGRLTMWRTVAGMEYLEPGSERADAAIDAFSELPPALRRIAGKEIVRHAVTSGRAKDADEVMRILDRTPGEMSSRESVLRARIAVQNGDVDKGLELAEVASQQPDMEPLQPLLVQAAAILSERAPVPVTLITDLEIELRHRRTSTEGLEILLTLAQLEAASGDPQSALERLDAAGAYFSDALPAISAVGRKILGDIDPRGLSAAVYASLVLNNRHLLGADRESVDLRSDLARGLIENGLPNAALELLGELQLLPTAKDRLLQAEARLDAEDALGALQLLDGLNQDAAARLRADAYLKLGSLDDAYRSLVTLAADDPDRNRMALLTRNWTDMSSAAVPSGLRVLADTLGRATMLSGDSDAREVREAEEAEASQPLSLAALQSRLAEASELRDAVEIARQSGE